MANKMDATFLRDTATWVMAELVRVFHGVTTTEAQESIDALVERSHPLVWEHNGVKRVLAPAMRAKDKVLVLLYSCESGAPVVDLQHWVRYKRNFVRQVLEPLARESLIEHDGTPGHAVITPLGSAYVEAHILTHVGPF